METLSGLHLNDIIKLQTIVIIRVSQREDIYSWHTLTNESYLMTMHESLLKEFFALTSWFRGIREDIKESPESFQENLTIQWADDIIYKNRFSSLKLIVLITLLK